jgi:menaquinone-dependent protoporphyrinogen oxidase
MKPIGIFYATREGLTERIAEYLAAAVSSHGFAVDLRNVADPMMCDPARYSILVLAASVHAGHHEPEMLKFVRQYARELRSVSSYFLSVSLSQAGVERMSSTKERRDHFAADVQKMIDAFVRDTGWQPKRIKPIAGALRYTKYNFFLRYIMKRIAKKAGAETDTSRDYEYTDWSALDGCADEICREIAGRDILRETG